MSAQAAVLKPAANAKYDAHDICDPVVHVGASVEVGLDEFYGPTVGRSANEDRKHTQASRTRQREGQRYEGD